MTGVSCKFLSVSSLPEGLLLVHPGTLSTLMMAVRWVQTQACGGLCSQVELMSEGHARLPTRDLQACIPATIAGFWAKQKLEHPATHGEHSDQQQDLEQGGYCIPRSACVIDDHIGALKPGCTSKVVFQELPGADPRQVVHHHL